MEVHPIAASYSEKIYNEIKNEGFDLQDVLELRWNLLVSHDVRNLIRHDIKTYLRKTESALDYLDTIDLVGDQIQELVLRKMR